MAGKDPFALVLFVVVSGALLTGTFFLVTHSEYVGDLSTKTLYDSTCHIPILEIHKLHFHNKEDALKLGFSYKKCS